LVDPILRELEIKFVRDRIDNSSTYLIDLEPLSHHLHELQN